MNFNNDIKYMGCIIPEDGELCKEMYFKARKPAQKYFLGDYVEGADGLIIKITVYCEKGIDDFAEVAPILYSTRKLFPWRNILMRNCDFYRLVEMGGGGFDWE